MIFTTLLLLALQPEPEQHSLDELYCGSLISAASMENDTAFVGMTAGQGVAFKIERFIFHHPTNQAVLINDPRVPTDAGKVIGGKQNFFFFGTISDTITTVNPKGLFLDTKRLERMFHDVQLQRMDLVFAAPYRQGKALLTMRFENTLFLVSMSPDSGKHEILHTWEAEADMLRYFWVSDGSRIFLVNGHTSEISLHDQSSGWSTRVLRRPVEPVRDKGIPSEVKGVSPWRVMMLNPISSKDTVVVRFLKWRDSSDRIMKKYKMRQIAMESGSIRERDQTPFPIGGSLNKMLMYDPIGGEFSLRLR